MREKLQLIKQQLLLNHQCQGDILSVINVDVVLSLNSVWLKIPSREISHFGSLIENANLNLTRDKIEESEENKSINSNAPHKFFANGNCST